MVPVQVLTSREMHSERRRIKDLQFNVEMESSISVDIPEKKNQGYQQTLLIKLMK